MTAAENARTHTSTVVAIAGLLLLSIAGCTHTPQNSPSERLLNASDTPIVISGGSIHFKAKNSNWQTCDGNPASSSTTCYKATFALADKKHRKHFQFVNDDGPNAVSVANVAKGWEVDVVDTNTTSPHMVLVCAESSDFATCDDHDPIKSDFIYVIAKGGGTFEMPDPNQPNKILYHDGNTQYDQISNIVLNVSSGKTEVTEPCTDSHCFLFLSK